jgi:uncharacterized membrane protein
MTNNSSIKTLEDIKNQYPVKNVNITHRQKLSKLDKIAVLVTEKIGTVGFFLIIFSWTVLWLSWNILAPEKLRFDPYPAFVLWLFISNLIQLHLLPLLMIGQNIQGKHAQLRAEHDFETDKKAEKEIETILNYMEDQKLLIKEILKKLDKLEKQ